MLARITIPLAVIIAAVLLSCACSAVARANVHVSAITADASADSPSGDDDTCMEDDPCWSWARMGNRKRGIVARNGHRRVVGACAFARMARNGHIDWRATDHLRGDRWARVHGCGRNPHSNRRSRARQHP